MFARKSSVFLLIVVFVAFATMAFVPVPAPRLQEGGPVLSDVQLVYIGIVASALLWVLKLIVARGYQPKREIIAIALYVVAFFMAILFTPITFPSFPPFSDAPSFVGALLAWIVLLVGLASPVAGMAFLIYNILLKRVLESIASAVTQAFKPAVVSTTPVLNVRAKFKVVSITQYEYFGKTVKLSAQYDKSIPEDRSFAQATPSGELTMFVNNPSAAEAFKAGQYVYLDFTPAE